MWLYVRIPTGYENAQAPESDAQALGSPEKRFMCNSMMTVGTDIRVIS